MDVDRFEYAWRWFSLHANQRYSMFNFFMLFAGILANALVLLMINRFHTQAGTLAVVAALMCGMFVFLDKRNRQLVHLGEQILTQLESEVAHGQGGEGPLSLDSRSRSPVFLKHWFLIEGVEVIAMAGFLSAAIWAFTA
jgi:hypothetical protein